VWNVCQSDTKGRTVAQLEIRQVQETDFHVYTIVAENSVSVAAKDIPLVHSQSLITLSVPLTWQHTLTHCRSVEHGIWIQLHCVLKNVPPLNCL